MRPPRSASAGEKVLFLLKTKGPQTAADLAQRLSVSPEAARQQLVRLEEDGLVRSEDEAGRVGRPRKLWRTTESAEEHFPDSHSELAVGLLDAVRAAFGETGVNKLLRERVAAQRSAYAQRMPGPEAPLSERVSALAALRREEGYLAEWRRAGDELRLIENHCPICVAAQSCIGLCEGELALFQELLGPEVAIERTEYMLEGARRCTYAIRPL